MIDVRILGDTESHVLEAVAPDVFDHPIDDRWASAFFADPRHHLAVAIDAGTVVGMASAVHYVHPDKPPELWINEVGVSEASRRQGLASKLLTCLMDHGRSLGCHEAWVLTEPDNEGARALYARNGGVSEETVLYAWKL